MTSNALCVKRCDLFARRKFKVSFFYWLFCYVVFIREFKEFKTDVECGQLESNADCYAKKITQSSIFHTFRLVI